MKKENKYSSKKFYTVTPVLLLVLMVVVSFLGVHIFRVQYDKNNLQEEIQDYKNYGKYYAMITTDDSADFWQSVYSGAKEEGENSDAYVELFAGNVGTNYSIEERLDIAIASDVDGIILEGEDGEGIRQKLEKAAENGIPVVMVSQDVSDSERISFVGISRYNLGQTYGKEITTLVGQMLSQDDNLYNGGTPLSVMVLIGNEDDPAAPAGKIRQAQDPSRDAGAQNSAHDHADGLLDLHHAGVDEAHHHHGGGGGGLDDGGNARAQQHALQRGAAQTVEHQLQPAARHFFQTLAHEGHTEEE